MGFVLNKCMYIKFVSSLWANYSNDLAKNEAFQFSKSACLIWNGTPLIGNSIHKSIFEWNFKFSLLCPPFPPTQQAIVLISLPYSALPPTEVSV